MGKSRSLEGMGRVLINGQPLNDENRGLASKIVIDGFIRAAYSMRDTGQLTDRLNSMLHQYEYKSPITGEVYGRT